MRIIGVKNIVEDETQEFPGLVATPPNLDYDGDETNLVVIWEKAMQKAFLTIHPKEMILSKNKPRVDTEIIISTPALITLNSFIDEEDRYLEDVLKFEYPEESPYIY
jgi:hypothetical protein